MGYSKTQILGLLKKLKAKKSFTDDDGSPVYYSPKTKYYYKISKIGNQYNVQKGTLETCCD